MPKRKHIDVTAAHLNKDPCSGNLRWFDGLKMNCALKSCQAVLQKQEVVVVVTTSLKVYNNSTEVERTRFLVKWQLPRCLLHKQCFEKVEKLCEHRAISLEKIVKSPGRGLLRNEKCLVKEAVVECYDGVDTVRKKAKLAAELMVGSAHIVAFTGAGLSTSAGIPDYRGTKGIDSLQDLGYDPYKVDDEGEGESDTPYEDLKPTSAHKLLTALHDLGKMSYVITQNCDNLHYKGGFPRNKLSELHGNVFVEFCEKCGKEYVRDYAVDAYSTDCYNEPYYIECQQCSWNHYTGRKCSKKGCKGKLRDTIVNFGDDLHDSVCGGLSRAEKESQQADVCLTLGTSLTVSPANTLPRMAKNLVICNIQPTDLDKYSTIRTYASCDMFTSLLYSEVLALLNGQP